jgi:hypothetical protein
MGWEERNGRRYLYRKRRIRRRVVSEYIGAGDLAEAISALDDLSRLEASLKQAEWREQRAAERALDHQIDHVIDMARILAAAELLANGYHQHGGQWRRRRDGNRDGG